MINEDAFIYGLIDPRTDLVCYVGKSSQGMKRPKHTKRNGPVGRWISELHSIKLIYVIAVLERIERPDDKGTHCHWRTQLNPTALNDAECWWIAYGKALGWPLLNRSEGGEGTRGCRPSPETKKRMSDARNLYVKNNPGKVWGIALPEVRARYSGDASPQKRPEVREKHRMNSTPRFQSPSMRQLNSVQLKQLWETRRDEILKKMNDPTLINMRRGWMSNKNHPIHSANSIAKRSGINHPKHRSDVLDSDIVSLRSVGLTHALIAQRLKCSKAYVTKRLLYLSRTPPQ